MIDFFRRKEKSFLVLDIGTEAVKTLLFKKVEKIIILGNWLEYYDRFGLFDSQDFEAEILKRTIVKTLQNLREKKQEELPVILSLPATLLKAGIVFRALERKNPQKIIDQSEANEIVEGVKREAKEKLSQIQAWKKGILPQDIQFINLKILERKIDGYDVSSLQGFTGKKLDFRILATFLAKDYFALVKKISQELGLEILQIIHLAENLTEMAQEQKLSGIFLDIGGEVSQIFLVKKGQLEKVDTFAGGGKVFLESLSQVYGMDFSGVRNLVQDYQKKLLTEGVRKEIKHLFVLEVQKWFEDLKICLGREEKPLPSSIYLFGGGSLIPEIEEILQEGDWNDFLFDSPKIKILYPKDLKNIEDQTKSLNSPQDIPPLLLCYTPAHYETKNF